MVQLVGIQVVPDKDIANMSYYVEGVEGALPKK